MDGGDSHHAGCRHGDCADPCFRQTEEIQMKSTDMSRVIISYRFCGHGPRQNCCKK